MVAQHHHLSTDRTGRRIIRQGALMGVEPIGPRKSHEEVSGRCVTAAEGGLRCCLSLPFQIPDAAAQGQAVALGCLEIPGPVKSKPTGSSTGSMNKRLRTASSMPSKAS